MTCDDCPGGTDWEQKAECLRAENDRLREFLHYIAEPDDLLDANEEVFNEAAARRMQAQARAALEATT